MSIRLVISDELILNGQLLRPMRAVMQSYGMVPWLLPVTTNHYQYFNTEHFAFLENDYNPMDISSTLEKGGATRIKDFMNNEYTSQPNFFTAPNTEFGSLAVQPPSVPHLHVIYSTGRNTEIGAYYKQEPGNVLTLDDSDRRSTKEAKNFIVEKGIRLETSETYQSIDGTFNSGDSVVPYGSLAYFKKWQQDYPNANITSKVLTNPDHNSIVKDPDFPNEIIKLISR